MIHTLGKIISLSREYDREHGVQQSDLDKANYYSRVIEDTRADCPIAGDVFVCKGPEKTYLNGHLDNFKMDHHTAICVMPYVPFAFVDDTGVSYSTSGGYWFGIPPENIQDIKNLGQRPKLFQTWGHCGACGAGAFYFEAMVNVWKIYLESIY